MPSLPRPERRNRFGNAAGTPAARLLAGRGLFSVPSCFFSFHFNPNWCSKRGGLRGTHGFHPPNPPSAHTSRTSSPRPGGAGCRAFWSHTPYTGKFREKGQTIFTEAGARQMLCALRVQTRAVKLPRRVVRFPVGKDRGTQRVG